MSKHNDLLQLIPKGKEHAISNRELASVLHTTKRELQRLVLQARLDENIIASGSNGYYIPQTDEEMMSYYKTQRKRAMTTLSSLRTVRRILKQKGIKV